MIRRHPFTLGNVLAVTGTHPVPVPIERWCFRRTLAAVRAWIATPEGAVALGGVLFFGAYCCWLVLGPSSDHRAVVADIWNLPLVGGAALAAWLTSRVAGTDRRLRRGWRLAAMAFLCYTIGNVLWLLDEFRLGQVPVVSVADVVYLAYYPLLFGALVSFPVVERTRSEVVKLSLDVATVVIAGGTAVWFYLLAPALDNPATTPLETLITLAYPVGDLVLLFGSAFAIFHRPSPAGRGALMLLAVGGLVVFLTDLLYGHIVIVDGDYASGHPVDLGWQLAAVLWFLAAQYQRFSLRQGTTSTSDTPQYKGVSLLPYIAGVATGIVLLFSVALPNWSRAMGLAVCTVILLCLIVVVRQVLAVLEIGKLVAERGARESRFRAMVQHSSDVISIVDRTGVILFVSPAVEQVLNWPASFLTGRNLELLIHPDELAGARAFLRSLVDQPGTTSSLICRFLDGGGTWRHVETTCSSWLDDPSIGGLVLNTRDVSDRMRLEAELTQRAFRDPLTGLANRARFHAATDEALRKPQRRLSHVTVIYLDLDNFKIINDTLGHLHGDQLLVEFSARLLNATRGCDTVSRLGGDEFAVLLEGLPRDEDAMPVADRIVASLQKPFQLGGTEVMLAASIGVAHARSGATAELLLRDADIAMYAAKREGKGRYTVFGPEMQHEARNLQELEADLRRALHRNEFAVAFQPVVELRTGRVVFVEALARWKHPSRGLLTPEYFGDAAIQSGLIAQVGRVVLQNACAQLAEWRRHHREFHELCVSVNVAGSQFQNEGFPTQVAATLERTGVPADRLILEVTESEIMRDTGATLNRLHSLKALGVKVAIDDFGTGYSSLAYLQRFPVDVLKIDKSFVDHVAFEGHGQSLSRMIIALGETLGICSVAVGIEDADQAKALASMGCEFAQGYYYSAPLTSDELLHRVLRVDQPGTLAGSDGPSVPATGRELAMTAL